MTSPSPIENNQLQKKLHFLLDEYVDGKTYNKMWEPLMSLIEQAVVDKLKDVLDRAEAGEVVEIKRNGKKFHLSTFDGFVAGQQRVVDAALTLGQEVERHKNKTRLQDNQGASNGTS